MGTGRSLSSAHGSSPSVKAHGQRREPWSGVIEGARFKLALLRCDQVVHRCSRAAFAVRNAGQFERHFNGRNRAEDHRLVQIAEMADAEDMTAQPVEPAAKRHVELVETELADLIGVVAL